MRNLALTFIFSFLVFLQIGSAQTEKGTWILGGNASFTSINDASILHLNPNIGKFVANKFVIGLNGTFLHSDGTSVIGLGPYVRGYFLTSEKGSLFGQAGFNYLTISGDGISDSETGYGLGLGYAVFLNRSVALEFSGNYSKYNFDDNSIIGIGSNSSSFSINVGFQIHFNKFK